MFNMTQQTLLECTIKVINRSTSKIEFGRRVPSTMLPSEVVSLATLLIRVIPNSYSVIEYMPYDCGNNK